MLQSCRGHLAVHLLVWVYCVVLVMFILLVSAKAGCFAPANRLAVKIVCQLKFYSSNCIGVSLLAPHFSCSSLH